MVYFISQFCESDLCLALDIHHCFIICKISELTFIANMA